MIVKYVGGSGYVAGIPARDMTGDEWAALTAAQRALALRLGLFEEKKG